MQPAYAFSIPSVEDDTPLDCRIYHPEKLASVVQGVDHVPWIKGAILAHPYAPRGGCQDDHVVLATTETLLDQGFVVGTFNFRGANDSTGRTTWTGKAELQDYVSFTGFLFYYLSHLRQLIQPNDTALSNHSSPPSDSAKAARVQLILGGYSYGSLILARFPPTQEIITRFESAVMGTAAAEIILRARTLAKQSYRTIEEQQQEPSSPRGRTLKPAKSPLSPSHRVSPMTMGGEETDPSERRRSRDSRRSADVIRRSVEVPQRIKAHMKHRHHVSREHSSVEEEKNDDKAARPTTSSGDSVSPVVSTKYLFISPVLLPFSNTLLPPGAPTAGFSFGGKGDAGSTKQYLHHPTLALFGSSDAFTSSKRLRHWAEKQTKESQAEFHWSEVEGAGHFWGEEGVLHALQQRIAEWSVRLDEERKQGIDGV